MTNTRCQRRIYLNLFLLALPLASLLGLYWVLRRIEEGKDVSVVQLLAQAPHEATPLYQPGQTVQLLQAAQTNATRTLWKALSPWWAKWLQLNSACFRVRNA